MRRPRLAGPVVPMVLALALLVAGCGKDNTSASVPQRAVAPAGAGDSLFTESNLKVALNAIRAKLGSSPKVAIFKIEPRSVGATVADGSRFELLTSDKSGAVTTAKVPFGGPSTFPLSKISAATPGKMLDQLSSKYNKKLDDIDYMVALADPVSRTPFWDIFVKGGVQGPYQADIDGSHLATATERATSQAKSGSASAPPVGAPPGPGPAPLTGKTSTALPPNIAKIQQCVTKAGNDPAKAADCVRHAKTTSKP